MKIKHLFPDKTKRLKIGDVVYIVDNYKKRTNNTIAPDIRITEWEIEKILYRSDNYNTVLCKIIPNNWTRIQCHYNTRPVKSWLYGEHYFVKYTEAMEFIRYVTVRAGRMKI